MLKLGIQSDLTVFYLSFGNVSNTIVTLERYCDPQKSYHVNKGHRDTHGSERSGNLPSFCSFFILKRVMKATGTAILSYLWLFDFEEHGD